ERKALEDRVRDSFWKDPFSSEVVPVRKEDRELLRAHAARVARAHGRANDDEIAQLRDALATARAENARLRAELAHFEESAGGGDGDAQAESVPPPSRHLHARRSESVRAHAGPPPPREAVRARRRGGERPCRGAGDGRARDDRSAGRLAEQRSPGDHRGPDRGAHSDPRRQANQAGALI